MTGINEDKGEIIYPPVKKSKTIVKTEIKNK